MLRLRIAVVLLLSLLAASQQVAAQDPCSESVLAEAQNLYDGGSFDDAIDLLGPCVEVVDSVSFEQAGRIFELLGLAYYAKSLEAEARTAVCRLLTLSPEYPPDSVELSPRYRSLVESVRQLDECAPAPPEAVIPEIFVDASDEVEIEQLIARPDAQEVVIEFAATSGKRTLTYSIAVFARPREASGFSDALIPLRQVSGDVGPAVAADRTPMVIRWNGWEAEGLRPDAFDLVINASVSSRMARRKPWALIGGVAAASVAGGAACLTGLICGSKTGGELPPPPGTGRPPTTSISLGVFRF